MVCPSDAPQDPFRSKTQVPTPAGSTWGSRSVIQFPDGSDEGAAAGAGVAGAADGSGVRVEPVGALGAGAGVWIEESAGGTSVETMTATVAEAAVVAAGDDALFS